MLRHETGLCAGAGLPHQRESQFPVSCRSIQRAEQGQPGHTEPLREYTAVRNDYHGDDAGTRNAVERQAFVLNIPEELSAIAKRRDVLSAGRGRAILNCCPGVAELADALDSKSSGT